MDGVPINFVGKMARMKEVSQERDRKKKYGSESGLAKCPKISVRKGPRSWAVHGNPGPTKRLGTCCEGGIEFPVEMMTSGVAKFEGQNANEPGPQHLFIPNPPKMMWGKEKKESELINHRNARSTLLCELRGLF